jgi:hypothetical protein
MVENKRKQLAAKTPLLQRAPFPHLDRSKREDGTFSRQDFRYDESTDTYTCLKGKTLTTIGRINAGDRIFYRSSLVDCDSKYQKDKIVVS